jgi:glutaredoxin
MTKKVTLYSTETCGYCHMLKKYLDDSKIKYIEKRVDTDPAAAQEMITKSGQMGVPFTVINDGRGHEETVLGFDVVKINSILMQSN